MSNVTPSNGQDISLRVGMKEKSVSHFRFSSGGVKVSLTYLYFVLVIV